MNFRITFKSTDIQILLIFFVESALNQDQLEEIDIFVIFNFPIHNHSISFHEFRSCLISFLFLFLLNIFLFYLFFYCCSSKVVCIFPPPFSPQLPPFTPPSPIPLPLGFVHVSYIVVTEKSSHFHPNYPLPPPLWLLSDCP